MKLTTYAIPAALAIPVALAVSLYSGVSDAREYKKEDCAVTARYPDGRPEKIICERDRNQDGLNDILDTFRFTQSGKMQKRDTYDYSTKKRTVREWRYNADGRPEFAFRDEGNDGKYEKVCRWEVNNFRLTIKRQCGPADSTWPANVSTWEYADLSMTHATIKTKCNKTGECRKWTSDTQRWIQYTSTPPASNNVLSRVRLQDRNR